MMKAIIIGVLSIATAFECTGTIAAFVNKSKYAWMDQVAFSVLFGILMFFIFFLP